MFEYAYDRFYKEGDIETYRKFLDIVETFPWQHLNRNVPEKLEKIKKGIDIGNYEDPYFTINRLSLSALYHDAKLAKEKGHFLTANHRDVLIKAEENTEDELIEHNEAWAKRFEEAKIEGEDEISSKGWRFNPRFFVLRELKEREKILEGKFPSFYNYEMKPLWSRNTYQEDERWPIDIDKTRINFEKRELRRRAKKLGTDEETLLELDKDYWKRHR